MPNIILEAQVASNSITNLFNYKEKRIRTKVINNEIWFVAKDICDVLEIANSRDAMSSLSNTMKMTLEGKNNIVGIADDDKAVRISLVSEPGMYKLAFKSRKTEAENFTDWVVTEVLPAIRKTGSYGITKKELSPMMERFKLNAQFNSELGYWSMLNKMNELFALPLELAGLTLPDTCVVDISTGKMFCEYLRSLGINPDDITKKYTHIYPDGRKIPDVNKYPDKYYELFSDWLKNVWVKEKSMKYIFDRIGIGCIQPMIKAFPNQIDPLPLGYIDKHMKRLEKKELQVSK